MLTTTNPNADNPLADVRETTARHLKESQEMERSVSELCEKASVLSHVKSGSPFTTKLATTATKRTRGRQLKKENL